MRTRLLLAAICLLVLPVWLSPSKGNKLTSSTPFATVALAGHTIISGDWCQCGASGCICDPGEIGSPNARPTTDFSTIDRNPKAKMGRVSELDFGAGAFLIGLALFMWARFRA